VRPLRPGLRPKRKADAGACETSMKDRTQEAAVPGASYTLTATTGDPTITSTL
jgi:hypothetical protein